MCAMKMQRKGDIVRVGKNLMCDHLERGSCVD